MSSSQNRVAVVSAVRTAIGSFGGVLKDIEAAELGGIAIAAAIDRCKVNGAEIDEVLMGQVYTAGAGANPARIAALKAGLPNSVPATTVNKVCGSGMKSVVFGTQAILCGNARIAVAGGQESMSRAPYLLPGTRWGQRIGHGQLCDVILRDGLWDFFNDYHMAQTAENLAEKYSFSRQDQDVFAALSQNRCQRARQAGLFGDEITPVSVPQHKGDLIVIDADEHPRDDVKADTLSKLRPAFRIDGTITAGNASGMNDGAAAVVLMDEATARDRGLIPLAYITAFVSVGVDPAIMGIGPAMAIQKLLVHKGMRLDDIDLLEVNEAFAAQALAVGKELAWNADKVNVNGGAIALGHPLGASGTRIIVTLLHEMRRRDSRYGISALCIGGGMGISMLFERTQACR